MSDGRSYQEEQEVVTAAVISVLHALMDMTGDKELEPEVRLTAANCVLGFACETSIPDDEEESETPEVEEKSEESE